MSNKNKSVIIKVPILSPEATDLLQWAQQENNYILDKYINNIVNIAFLLIEEKGNIQSIDSSMIDNMLKEIGYTRELLNCLKTVQRGGES